MFQIKTNEIILGRELAPSGAVDENMHVRF